MSVNYTYFGDCYAVYANIESLYCIPETNMSIILQFKNIYMLLSSAITLFMK